MSQSSTKKALFCLYVVAILEALVVIAYYGGMSYPDTPGYISAWENAFSKSQLDIARTPVFPLFIGIAETFFGKWHLLTIVAIMQYAIAIFSIKYFFRLANMLLKSNLSAFCLTCFYYLLPSFSTWSNFVQTESLALSGSVFFCYFIVSFCIRGGYRLLLSTFFWLLFLIFLRPSFVYILPITFVIGLLLLRKKTLRDRSLALMIISVVSSLCLVAYMFQFKSRYGVFSSSMIGLVNEYNIGRQHGLLDPQKASNPRLRAYVIRCYEKDGKILSSKNLEQIRLKNAEADYAFSHFSLPDLKELVSGSYEENKSIWIQNTFKRILPFAEEPFFKSYIEFGTVHNIFGIMVPQGYVYIILLAYTIFIIYASFKKSRLLMFELFLLMLAGSNLIVIIVGSEDDFSRLYFPSKFIILMMLTQLIVEFYRHKNVFYKYLR